MQSPLHVGAQMPRYAAAGAIFNTRPDVATTSVGFSALYRLPRTGSLHRYGDRTVPSVGSLDFHGILQCCNDTLTPYPPNANQFRYFVGRVAARLGFVLAPVPLPFFAGPFLHLQVTGPCPGKSAASAGDVGGYGRPINGRGAGFDQCTLTISSSSWYGLPWPPGSDEK